MDKKITTEEINQTLGSGQNQKNFFLHYWWLWLLFIMIGGGTYLYIQNSQKKQQNSYKTTTLLTDDLIVSVSATGNLEPTNTVDIGIEVSGTIEQVFVDYSDIVTKGQVLAKLDTTKLASKVSNTKASLLVAKANLQESQVALKDAKRELNRLQKLYKSTGGNYPTVMEIDKAKTTYNKNRANIQAMQAMVSQAEASLKSDEEDLKKAVVVSSMDGIVLDKQVEVGQSVVASMQVPVLFTLAEDLTKMQVVVSVDEADVGQVRENQEVTFDVDAYPDKTFEGTIKQVRMNSQMVDGVVTYEALVEVDNNNLLLRPGMTVTADIITKKIENATLVPNAALRFVVPKNETKSLFSGPPGQQTSKPKKGSTLWILKDNNAVEIPVKTGENDGINTIITEGEVDLNSQIIIGLNGKSDE
ncbi:MAG: efflux RND transporter periplasmic adaptor subunit [Epsilonproteobacteria bacterium]|nr:efflux RND transporter periplasmic adaptor subunit [Campylobacterota bacterium]